MQIALALPDTQAAWSRLNTEECSRSLALNRFADPRLKDKGEQTPRKNFFRDVLNIPAQGIKQRAWLSFLNDGLGLNIDHFLFAQLQSRMMINMAGGVMENAGLCLDRFGLPFIPGSAVKGCARRSALAALHEWCETATRPGDENDGQNNVFRLLCAEFKTPAEMLSAIARVFGWCKQDWRPDSDFSWACAPKCEPIWGPVAKDLSDLFCWKITEELQNTPWKALPNLAGSISFLPAYPLDLGGEDNANIEELPTRVPKLGKLELDVVTVHHKQYYAEPPEPKGLPHSHPNWQKWEREHSEWLAKWGSAPDIEEPVPNFLPAVASGHVFAFALVPLRGSDRRLTDYARACLACGLSSFGLGAKTNAGYGWFDSSDHVQSVICTIVRKLAGQQRSELALSKAARHRLESAAEAERAETERLLKGPPCQRFKAEYLKLSDESFAALAKEIAVLDNDQKDGFVLALKEKRETAKRWAKRKPELLKPWQEQAGRLQPPVQLP